MLNRSSAKDHQARDLGTHIHNGTAVFPIVVGQYTFGGGERFEYELFDIDPRSRHRLN